MSATCDIIFGWMFPLAKRQQIRTNFGHQFDFHSISKPSSNQIPNKTSDALKTKRNVFKNVQFKKLLEDIIHLNCLFYSCCSNKINNTTKLSWLNDCILLDQEAPMCNMKWKMHYFFFMSNYFASLFARFLFRVFYSKAKYK